MATTTEIGSVLNSLLRGEISAVETYNQALERFGLNDGATELRRMQAEHRESVRDLRSHIHGHGEGSSTSSGAWGVWVELVEATAAMLGYTNAIRALKQGEEHGINEYEAALDDDRLTSECKDLIRTKLLPLCRSHVETLDRLIDRQ